MFVLLWVLLIRPQRQRQQKHQSLLSSVEPGDEILTVGGLYEIVQEIDDEDDLVVEVARGHPRADRPPRARRRRSRRRPTRTMRPTARC